MCRAQPGSEARQGDPPYGVDCDDGAPSRVGDERVAAVRVRPDVARLDEAVEDVPHAAAADDGDGADGRVAQDREVADPLDRTRVGECRDGRDHAEEPEVDHRKARLRVAGDERLERRRRERRAQAERHPCGKGDEFAAVHDCSTRQTSARVPGARFGCR
jgi:hypothetical protein